MDWHVIGGFLVATMILVLTPGPVMAIIIGNTLKRGKGTGFLTVLGIALGELLLIGALLLSFHLSNRLIVAFFPWLSLASAVYLLRLAMIAMRQLGAPASEDDAARQRDRPLVDGFLVTISNPTTILFYAAFFLPFTHAGSAAGPQLEALCAVYVIISLSFDMICVLCAAQLRDYLKGKNFLKAAQIGSMVVYLGTGILAIAAFADTILVNWNATVAEGGGTIQPHGSRLSTVASILEEHKACLPRAGCHAGVAAYS